MNQDLEATRIQDVVCKRHNHFGVCVNVPREIIHHSPDGYEWGYGGSGPADLALNILFFATGDRTFSFRWHQDFKWKHIASMPAKGGMIRREDVAKFVEEMRLKEVCE